MATNRGARPVALFILTFAVAFAVFAIAKWVGLDQSWGTGLVTAAVIAAVGAVWDAVAARRRASTT